MTIKGACLFQIVAPLLIARALLSSSLSTTAATPNSLREEIEWTCQVRPLHSNPNLPNVLLLGDSITRNYFPVASKLLSKEANVYLMAVSTSVGDLRLSHQNAELAEIERVHFQVVHFNKG